MTSTRLLNDFIMSFEYFYDATRLTIYRRLYCLYCYLLLKAYNFDFYRSFTCDERMETIGRIACIRLLLD